MLQRKQAPVHFVQLGSIQEPVKCVFLHSNNKRLFFGVGSKVTQLALEPIVEMNTTWHTNSHGSVFAHSVSYSWMMGIICKLSLTLINYVEQYKGHMATNTTCWTLLNDAPWFCSPLRGSLCVPLYTHFLSFFAPFNWKDTRSMWLSGSVLDHRLPNPCREFNYPCFILHLTAEQLWSLALYLQLIRISWVMTLLHFVSGTINRELYYHSL